MRIRRAEAAPEAPEPAAFAVPSDLLAPLPADRVDGGASRGSETETGARRLRDEIVASPDFQPTQPARVQPPVPSAAGRGPRLERVLTLAIRPSPVLARRHLDAGELARLTASIRQNGLAQPLLVRALPERPGSYELFVGYRRWRAALAAKIAAVPAIVFDGLRDAVALELNLLENVNRRDLTLLEQAEAYRQLTEVYGRTEEQIAILTGRSVNQVRNMLLLLELPDEVKALLRMGEITFAHARLLLDCADPLDLARHIVAGRLTVREAEALAAQIKTAAQGGAAAAGDVPQAAAASAVSTEPGASADMRLLQAELAVATGTRFEIGTDGGEPALVIRGRTEGDVDRAVDMLRNALKMMRTTRALRPALRETRTG
jgi:ParB family chromosome partitioning protein